MRKVTVMLLVVLVVCAIATTASAGLLGPGPTPGAYTSSLRVSK